jgi:hypothetical protein
MVILQRQLVVSSAIGVLAVRLKKTSDSNSQSGLAWAFNLETALEGSGVTGRGKLDRQACVTVVILNDSPSRISGGSSLLNETQKALPATASVLLRATSASPWWQTSTHIGVASMLPAQHGLKLLRLRRRGSFVVQGPVDLALSKVALINWLSTGPRTQMVWQFSHHSPGDLVLALSQDDSLRTSREETKNSDILHGGVFGVLANRVSRRYRRSATTDGRNTCRR